MPQTDLDLLRAHAPDLRFDALECLRPTTMDDYVGRSALLDARGRPRTVPDGPTKLGRPRTPRWSLDPLAPARPPGAEEASDRLLATYGAGGRSDEQGACYGRVVRARRAAFLQYWLFYVDNPCVLPVGRHDGDWELVQLRLDGDGDAITHVTLAQHGHPETHAVAADGRPEVFVAAGSHACYFDAGTQPSFPLPDECDGAQRPAVRLEVAAIPDGGWPRWRGRWGVNRGPGTWLATLMGMSKTPVFLRFFDRIAAGASPPSPACQGVSWRSPATFFRLGRSHSVTRVALRSLVHWLGKATWPRAEVSVRVERDGPDGVSIAARRTGHGPRAVHRVAVRLEHASTQGPLGVHTVRADGRPRRFATGPPGALAWRAAGYNILRQRGQVGDRHELD